MFIQVKSGYYNRYYELKDTKGDNEPQNLISFPLSIIFLSNFITIY